MTSEEVVETYQYLLKKELCPFARNSDEVCKDFIQDSNNKKGLDLKTTLITEKDLNDVCKKYNCNKDELKKYLIKYESLNGYHTAHFESIYRIIHIRNFPYQPPIPLEYILELDKDLVPEYNESVSDVIKFGDPQLENIVIKAISKVAINGKISSFQKDVIETINKENAVAVVAPTASGKTLSFLVPVIARAAERVKKRINGTSALLIYPRKALERDQLRTLLSIVDELNEQGVRVTVGIYDGDTPNGFKKEEIERIKGRQFRGLTCTKCGSNLIYSVENGKVIIKCKNCGKQYLYILPTKNDIKNEPPTILISNIYTVYRRLLSESTIHLFESLDYVVLDEIHVYTDFLGGHVRYVLGMLRYVPINKKNGKAPKFIFSSATIADPKTFFKEIYPYEDKIEIKDYNSEYKKSNKERLIIRLYLLPNPNLSTETLYEAVGLASTLWAYKYDQKVISFVDSIAEISHLYDYIYTTILGEREGREVIDHVFKKDGSLWEETNDYSWIHLVPNDVKNGNLVDGNKLREFILNTMKKGINIHYSYINETERHRRENEFQEGKIRHLISTSTLELGIDIKDIGLIIQYKLPQTSEAVVQRIGRAGRSNKSLRVALGLVTLPLSPVGAMYMYNDELRDKLSDISKNIQRGVGHKSDVIKSQAALSLVLFKRALEGKPTFMDNIIKKRKEAIDAIREILNEITTNYNDIIKLGNELYIEDINKKLDELKRLLEKVVDVKTNVDSSILTFDELDKLKVKIYEYLRVTNEFKKILERYIENYENIAKEVGITLNNGEKFLNALSITTNKIAKLLGKVLSLISNLANNPDNSYVNNLYKEIQNLINEITNDFNNDLKNERFISDFEKERDEIDKRKPKEHRKLRLRISNLVNEGEKLLYLVDNDESDEANDPILRFISVKKFVLEELINLLNNISKTDWFIRYIFANINNLFKGKTLRKGLSLMEFINYSYKNIVKFSLFFDIPLPEFKIKEADKL
ncbi:DEAD/DEAH box helicase [Acidianus sulfidivorans JP7]|nr:DEAD/DEAH box helicase [Acidianus sulfidivorans]AWR96156.2 DEAD/DEAH box helicase [Acidianus sulfidivorans JP7]